MPTILIIQSCKASRTEPKLEILEGGSRDICVCVCVCVRVPHDEGVDVVDLFAEWICLNPVAAVAKASLLQS